MLAGDVQTLNGASTEAVATSVEAGFSLIWAIVLGFYISWPLALCFMFLVPFMMLGGVL